VGELLRDPFRDRFTASGEFFFPQKWELIEGIFRAAGHEIN
jgi:hypothetical protein